jgi:RNA polymerase sigma-70 factor (ECF subfamily)
MPLRGGVSSEPDDDFALMRRIASGDRVAMDLLYRRYSVVVFSLCLRITGDRGTAEDLLIDVFFELWRKADRFDAARGAPLTYITTLARSRAIDRRRTKSSRMQAIGGVDSDDALEAASAGGGGRALVSGGQGTGGGVGGPEENVSLVERAGKVREALARLEDEHRKTLELSYFEGLSHSEIAAKLGKPLGTVKTHIRMGIIRIRELLRIEP